jgi:SNF family Na+-dependent transporter
VWRFPYLCYKNGGGAFLIPFLLFLFLLGIPLMYMELAIGQFTSRGPVQAWCMVPIARGIGISSNIVNNYLSAYYIMILGYSFYYLFLSLRSTLPWEKCGDWAGKSKL